MSKSREMLIKELNLPEFKYSPCENVTIDKFKPEYAWGIAKCYYETYGETFPVTHVYDPEEIIKHSESKDTIFRVALNEHGQVIGIISLFRSAPDKGVYELGQMIVIKQFRHLPVALNLAAGFVEKTVSENEITALFGEAVCDHVVTQVIGHQSGLITTGFEVGVMPFASSDVTEKIEGRGTLTQGMKVCRDLPQTLYLPSIYKSQVEFLYAGFNIERKFIFENCECENEKSSFNFINYNFAKSIKIFIDKPGKDAIGQIEKIENENPDAMAIQVYLNTAVKGAGAIAETLKNKKYFLGGIQPMWFGNDSFMMQKVNFIPNFDYIKLRAVRSKDILKMVRADYESII